ncbi:transmembrane protein 263 isoform X2 [Manis pentadactyla]|uniref:transmembrane protein 263 isoform X2 n=1 Tax=Manis pentadactyla TaxID=143292 RepID=UPI00255C65FC|nr:transmembrane protein 263 isoform X2 [Manis pentadactyla]
MRPGASGPPPRASRGSRGSAHLAGSDWTAEERGGRPGGGVAPAGLGFRPRRPPAGGARAGLGRGSSRVRTSRGRMLGAAGSAEHFEKLLGACRVGVGGALVRVRVWTRAAGGGGSGGGGGGSRPAPRPQPEAAAASVACGAFWILSLKRRHRSPQLPGVCASRLGHLGPPRRCPAPAAGDGLRLRGRKLYPQRLT